MGTLLYAALQLYDPPQSELQRLHWITIAIFEHNKDYDLQHWVVENAQKVLFDKEWPEDARYADNHFVREDATPYPKTLTMRALDAARGVLRDGGYRTRILYWMC